MIKMMTDKGNSTMLCIRRKLRRTAVIFFLVVAGCIFKMFTMNNMSTVNLETSRRNEYKKSGGQYLVDTPLCRIPSMDPNDSTIHHIVRKTGRRSCTRTTLTYQHGHTLYINWTAALLLPYGGSVKYCTYTPLHRPLDTPTHNNYLRYLEESEPFNDSVNVEHEFVKVTCYNHQEKAIYTNYNAFIIVNNNISSVLRDRFVEHKQKGAISEPLNVVMIGMDSVSRLSFIRQMVKTGELLRENLGAYDMMGYNKVADNTFINIVPMTLGKFASEMPWDENKPQETFDDFSFIWKQFSSKGYRTFYAEDAPEIAIFDFLKAGFKTPPADHFNRPLSLAMELKQNLWFNDHHCFQDRLETEIVLDYLHDFLDTYKNEPHFAFTFITRLSHDDVNSAGAADEPYYQFFKSLHSKDLIRNTILFFFSDHGMRFGPIRETHIGKLEERLPFMYVVVPSWLQRNYPHVNKNLNLNQYRLSTPFDVYQTLQDILFFDGKIKTVHNNSRGMSWFREISTMRSCDKAGILPHWCTCLSHTSLHVTSDVVVKASATLLAEILNELHEYQSICEKLSLRSVKQAARLVESDDVLTFIANSNAHVNKNLVFGDRTKPYEDIQVTIETLPGNALFEATVRLDTVHNSYMVVGDISRINIYRDQSDCIDVFKLKKFCQCIL